MRFKEALFDGSDPLYAPGLTRAKQYFYWRAPKKYVDLGCKVRRVKLDGVAGDGNDEARALRCRELTLDMLRQFSSAAPEIGVGTWRWIIHRYQNDQDSPYQEVKMNTREVYDILLNTWVAAIGDAPISKANYQAAKRWERVMRENGRSASWVHRMFTMIRTVTNYGALIEDKECIRFSAVLGKMRIKKGKPGRTEGTDEEVTAIIRMAAEDGKPELALGWSLQWWFAMRAVDVRGQWLPLKPGEEPSGIMRDGMRWGDGLTWDMIDRGVTRIVKVPSKTERSTGEIKNYDLTLIPEVRDQLASVPMNERIGPVIINPRTGQPYTKSGWAQAWRRYRNAAGIGAHVKNMGIRATALTQGVRAGASPFELRDAAGHRNVSTTDGYIRGADEATAKVLRLRRDM